MEGGLPIPKNWTTAGSQAAIDLGLRNFTASPGSASLP
jgi:hypothetical protein